MSTPGPPSPARSLSELLALIREDYETHGRDSSLPGFRALVVYRVGAWREGMPRGVVRKGLGLVIRTLRRYVRNQYGIEIEPTASIGRRVKIAHGSAVILHPYAVVGDECILRHEVTLGGASSFTREEAPTLGRGVDVFPGAKILGAVTVGDGARIGANSVVLADVPPGVTAFGVPARIMRPPAGQEESWKGKASNL